VHIYESAAYDARQIIEDYLAHWLMLASLAAPVKNLMQPLERDWINRSISEKRKGILLIVDLRTVVWRHEILEVGVDSTEAATGSKLQRALKTLQAQGEDRSHPRASGWDLEGWKMIHGRFIDYRYSALTRDVPSLFASPGQRHLALRHRDDCRSTWPI
jgi:hypothetical protein